MQLLTVMHAAVCAPRSTHNSYASQGHFPLVVAGHAGCVAAAHMPTQCQ